MLLNLLLWPQIEFEDFQKNIVNLQQAKITRQKKYRLEAIATTKTLQFSKEE